MRILTQVVLNFDGSGRAALELHASKNSIRFNLREISSSPIEGTIRTALLCRHVKLMCSYHTTTYNHPIVNPRQRLVLVRSSFFLHQRLKSRNASKAMLRISSYSTTRLAGVPMAPVIEERRRRPRLVMSWRRSFLVFAAEVWISGRKVPDGRTLLAVSDF